ncbi:MAG: hypothetical protein JSR80_07230, partial [Verrucomicrobia bacterium]|nr:hypothetical protein [Verrucomicrobiota bacterium]
MKSFLIACFLFISLWGNPETCPIPPMVVAVEPLGLVNGCVDVATGAYIASTAEVRVNCHEPISLYRQLISCQGSKDSHSFWQIGKEYIDFRAPPYDRAKEDAFHLISEQGGVTKYHVDPGQKNWGFHRRGKPFVLLVDRLYPGANPSSEALGGRTHPCNHILVYGESCEHKIVWDKKKDGLFYLGVRAKDSCRVGEKWSRYGKDAFTLCKGDGEVRVYTHGSKRWSDYEHWETGKNREPKQETFLLREVLRPNGNRIFYFYDGNDQLTEIRSTNGENTQTFGWIQIAHAGSTKIITTSDGQQVTYHLGTWKSGSKKKEVLEQISGLGGAQESFHYHCAHKTNTPFALTVYRAQGRELLGTSYYSKGDHTGKVQKQFAPFGGQNACIYEFFYKDETTTVKDAVGGSTSYYTDGKGRLCHVEKFDAQGKRTLFLQQKWDKNVDLNERSLGKTSPHQPGFITTLLSCRFFYDLYHNVTLEMLEGGLTGIENEKYLDRYTTHYTYSAHGFTPPHSQKDDLQAGVNGDKEGTDLLIERKIYEG